MHTEVQYIWILCSWRAKLKLHGINKHNAEIQGRCCSQGATHGISPRCLGQTECVSTIIVLQHMCTPELSYVQM